MNEDVHLRKLTKPFCISGKHFSHMARQKLNLRHQFQLRRRRPLYEALKLFLTYAIFGEITYIFLLLNGVRRRLTQDVFSLTCTLKLFQIQNHKIRDTVKLKLNQHIYAHCNTVIYLQYCLTVVILVKLAFELAWLWCASKLTQLSIRMDILLIDLFKNLHLW